MSKQPCNSCFEIEIPKKGDNLSQKRLKVRLMSKNLACSEASTCSSSPSVSWLNTADASAVKWLIPESFFIICFSPVDPHLGTLHAEK